MTQLTLAELERHPWGAADLLRGSIDSGDFKHYIFGLLFYKRLCDVWEEEYEERLAEYENATLAADPEEHRFHVPEGCFWQDVRKVSVDIGTVLNVSFRAIEDANPRLKGVFQDVDFANKERFPRAPWFVAGLGFAAATLVAVALFPNRAERLDAPPRDRQTISIESFRPTGGQSGADGFGELLGEVLRSGVLQLGAVRVVHRDADPRTSSDLQVRGSYFFETANVSVTAQIVDPTTGEVLDATQSIVGSVDSLTHLAERVRDRVLTALLRRTDQDVGPFPAEPGHIPRLAAYQAYASGDRRYVQGNYLGAVEEFNRAVDIDPDFMLPRLRTAAAFSNASAFTQADSVLLSLDEFEQQLLPHEAAYADMVGAWLKGDYREALRASRVIVSLTPGSRVEYDVANSLRKLNRPHEALETFAALDPDSEVFVGFASFWLVQADVYHMVGDYGAELEVTREGLRREPDRSSLIGREARALAALGEVAALDDSLRHSESVAWSPSGRSNPGTHYRLAAEELRAHGHGGAAEYFRRGTAWYRRQIPEIGVDSELARGLIRIQYEAGDWNSVANALEGLAVDRDIELTGYQGAVAFRLGDIDTARALEETLLSWSDPYARGYHTHWAARLAAVSGRTAEAISRLRKGYSEGQQYGRFHSSGTDMSLHSLIDFQPLQGMPGFDALITPAG